MQKTGHEIWTKPMVKALFMSFSGIYGCGLIPRHSDITSSENALDLLNSLGFYTIFRNCHQLHFSMSWFNRLKVAEYESYVKFKVF